jgi:large subunit ribosomal protein L24
MIKKGDQVVVITGKDKGKKGKVLSVIEKTDKLTGKVETRVVVDGVNIMVKNRKARSAKEKSTREKKPTAIDISNVMILCKCGKATRITHKIENGKKYRVCSHCGEVLDKKYVKVKAKEKAAVEEKPEEKEKEEAAKKPLVRREIKHTADSKIKKPQNTVKSPTTTHRQLGGGA